MSTETIHLSDTHDSYKRTLMITSRNGKVSFVQRWKDRNSGKQHTQRFTLSNDEAAAMGYTIVDIAWANIMEGTK